MVGNMNEFPNIKESPSSIDDYKEMIQIATFYQFPDMEDHSKRKLFEIMHTQEASYSREDVIPGKLFVGGIKDGTSEDTLRKYFTKFGSVKHCVIMKQFNQEKSRHFGFVYFDNHAAILSVLNMTDHEVDGRKLDVRPAHFGGSGGRRGRDQAPRGHAVDGAEPEQETYRIYVRGLSNDITKEDITRYFTTYGEVQQVHMHPGYCFVAFYEPKVLIKVFSGGPRHIIQGCHVYCEVSYSKEEKRSRPRHGSLIFRRSGRAQENADAQNNGKNRRQSSLTKDYIDVQKNETNGDQTSHIVIDTDFTMTKANRAASHNRKMRKDESNARIADKNIPNKTTTKEGVKSDEKYGGDVTNSSNSVETEQNTSKISPRSDAPPADKENEDVSSKTDENAKVDTSNSDKSPDMGKSIMNKIFIFPTKYDPREKSPNSKSRHSTKNKVESISKYRERDLSKSNRERCVKSDKGATFKANEDEWPTLSKTSSIYQKEITEVITKDKVRSSTQFYEKLQRGKDKKLLKHFANKLQPASEMTDIIVNNVSKEKDEKEKDKFELEPTSLNVHAREFNPDRLTITVPARHDQASSSNERSATSTQPTNVSQVPPKKSYRQVLITSSKHTTLRKLNADAKSFEPRKTMNVLNAPAQSFRLPKKCCEEANEGYNQMRDTQGNDIYSLNQSTISENSVGSPLNPNAAPFVQPLKKTENGNMSVISESVNEATEEDEGQRCPDNVDSLPTQDLANCEETNKPSETEFIEEVIPTSSNSSSDENLENQQDSNRNSEQQPSFSISTDGNNNVVDDPYSIFLPPYLMEKIPTDAVSLTWSCAQDCISPSDTYSCNESSHHESVNLDPNPVYSEANHEQSQVSYCGSMSEGGDPTKSPDMSMGFVAPLCSSINQPESQYQSTSQAEIQSTSHYEPTYQQINQTQHDASTFYPAVSPIDPNLGNPQLNQSSNQPSPDPAGAILDQNGYLIQSPYPPVQPSSYSSVANGSYQVDPNWVPPEHTVQFNTPQFNTDYHTGMGMYTPVHPGPNMYQSPQPMMNTYMNPADPNMQQMNHQQSTYTTDRTGHFNEPIDMTKESANPINSPLVVISEEDEEAAESAETVTNQVDEQEQVDISQAEAAESSVSESDSNADHSAASDEQTSQTAMNQHETSNDVQANYQEEATSYPPVCSNQPDSNAHSVPIQQPNMNQYASYYQSYQPTVANSQYISGPYQTDANGNPIPYPQPPVYMNSNYMPQPTYPWCMNGPMYGPPAMYPCTYPCMYGAQPMYPPHMSMYPTAAPYMSMPSYPMAQPYQTAMPAASSHQPFTVPNTDAQEGNQPNSLPLIEKGANGVEKVKKSSSKKLDQTKKVKKECTNTPSSNRQNAKIDQNNAEKDSPDAETTGSSVDSGLGQCAGGESDSTLKASQQRNKILKSMAKSNVVFIQECEAKCKCACCVPKKKS